MSFLNPKEYASFSKSYMLSSQEHRDYRGRHRVLLARKYIDMRDWDLPDKWASKHPNSLQDVRRKCRAQFVYDFGLSQSAVLDVQQQAIAGPLYVLREQGIEVHQYAPPLLLRLRTA
jgi:hypothetical protein